MFRDFFFRYEDKSWRLSRSALGSQLGVRIFKVNKNLGIEVP